MFLRLSFEKAFYCKVLLGIHVMMFKMSSLGIIRKGDFQTHFVMLAFKNKCSSMKIMRKW